jgi:signal transduction histidine kinase
VREHDASIQCQSAPGQGTRFTLRLKLAQANAQLAAM